MRKIIIDTDCVSDDAVAIMMALKSEDVCIEAITTVCGNVPLNQATNNALMVIEVTNRNNPPIFEGLQNP